MSHPLRIRHLILSFMTAVLHVTRTAHLHPGQVHHSSWMVMILRGQGHQPAGQRHFFTYRTGHLQRLLSHVRLVELLFWEYTYIASFLPLTNTQGSTRRDPKSRNYVIMTAYKKTVLPITRSTCLKLMYSEQIISSSANVKSKERTLLSVPAVGGTRPSSFFAFVISWMALVPALTLLDIVEQLSKKGCSWML